MRTQRSEQVANLPRKVVELDDLESLEVKVKKPFEAIQLLSSINEQTQGQSVTC